MATTTATCLAATCPATMATITSKSSPASSLPVLIHLIKPFIQLVLVEHFFPHVVELADTCPWVGFDGPLETIPEMIVHSLLDGLMALAVWASRWCLPGFTRSYADICHVRVVLGHKLVLAVADVEAKMLAPRGWWLHGLWNGDWLLVAHVDGKEAGRIAGGRPAALSLGPGGIGQDRSK